MVFFESFSIAVRSKYTTNEPELSASRPIISSARRLSSKSKTRSTLSLRRLPRRTRCYRDVREAFARRGKERRFECR